MVDFEIAVTSYLSGILLYVVLLPQDASVCLDYLRYDCLLHATSGTPKLNFA